MLRGRRESQRLDSLARYLKLQGTASSLPVVERVESGCKHREHSGVSFQIDNDRVVHVFGCSGSQWARSRALGPSAEASPWSIKRLAIESVTGRVLAHLVALSVTELDEIAGRTSTSGRLNATAPAVVTELGEALAG